MGALAGGTRLQEEGPKGREMPSQLKITMTQHDERILSCSFSLLHGALIPSSERQFVPFKVLI